MAGCARYEEARLTFQDRDGSPKPPESLAVSNREPSPEPCVFGWERPARPVNEEDVALGPVVVRGQGRTREAWWYEPAATVARRLLAGDDPAYGPRRARRFAREILANGPDAYVGDYALIEVKAGTDAIVEVPFHSPVRMIPGGQPTVGGLTLEMGERRLRCRADGEDTLTFMVVFVVAGARCVPLKVEADGRAYTTVLRFGLRRCG